MSYYKHKIKDKVFIYKNEENDKFKTFLKVNDEIIPFCEKHKLSEEDLKIGYFRGVACNKCNYENGSESENVITSITYGKVEKIDEKRGFIRIYIAPEDNHNIYSPFSGLIRKIKVENGKLYDIKDPSQEFMLEFKSDKPTLNLNGTWSVGKTEFVVENERDSDIICSLYVGTPPYITDTIRFTFKPISRVRKGQRLGEIILGSHSEMIIPSDFSILVKKGDILNGPYTPIAHRK